MNTIIRTFGLSQHASNQVESWFYFVEKTLSRFQSDSELSKLNRSYGNSFISSDLLFQALTVADFYYKETDGLFNPYLGEVLCKLGYDKSFENLLERNSTPPSLPEQQQWKHDAVDPIQMDTSTQSIDLSPYASVDLGGIAKGWCAQEMCNRLKANGVLSGVIDAGGDIVVWGEDAQGLEIAVADPFDPERDLINLKMERGAGIATSNTLKRHWQDAHGKDFHHIVDPRTHQPGKSDLVQVTVLAPDLTTAEVYAKCMLILRSEEGMDWLQSKQPNIGVIGVRSDHSTIIGGAIEQYCSKEVF